ncbi:MAG: SpoIID/LytB domain-containing protein [Elusimicrobiota bacterium]
MRSFTSFKMTIIRHPGLRHAGMTGLLSVLLLFASACAPIKPIVRPPQSQTPPPVVEVPKPVDVEKPKAAMSTGSKVRIGIRAGLSSVEVVCPEPFIVYGPTLKKEFDAGKYLVEIDDKKISIDHREFGNKIRIHLIDSSETIEVKGLTYRGDIIVVANSDSSFSVINELGIDEYLKGVLPREVIITWPAEALKVQAVASRTYLASHLGRHSDQGFDLCSEVHCQVFGGTAKEDPRTNKAVDETSDQILLYEGKPVGAFFFSHCGGVTEAIGPVWGQTSKPYLQSIRCRYCSKNPRYNWKISFTDADILKLLKAKTKVKGHSLKSLKIAKKSASGRAERVSVTTDEGSYSMLGNEFRLALHPEKIRSTLWTRLKQIQDGYEFEGKGWGHGVGMCQWGAKGQAEEERNYEQILKFYYPGTHLGKWRRS